MHKIHKILERQIKRYLDEGGVASPGMEAFLKAVSDSYVHADEDRALLERSLDLSSAELTAINEQQQLQNEELRAAKSKLEKENAQAEALLFNIGDGVVATDQQGRVMIMNREAEHLLGWRADEVIGKFWSDIVHLVDEEGHTAPVSQRPFSQVLRTGMKREAKTGNYIYYVAKNGTRFPISGTISPIVVEGKTIGSINVFRDATRDYEIDRAKTEFVSLASHQLRTPLSTINWYGEMLIGGDVGAVNEEQKKYLSEIYQASRHMVELVDALLNVSRIDLGTFIIDAEPTNFKDVAESVIKDLTPQIRWRVIRFEKKYASHLPIVLADPKILRIVIQNLLTNAIKYTPAKGMVTLEIATHDLDIVISVSDTGMGIPEKQKEKIFTKLFRADNVREQETTGTGLGLYIVKSFIEKAGGRIWFESTENKGSTFYAAIPLTGMKTIKKAY